MFDLVSDFAMDLSHEIRGPYPRGEATLGIQSFTAPLDLMA